MEKPDTFPSSMPRIVLGSDNNALPPAEALTKAGYSIDLAGSYDHIEQLWLLHRHEVVLIEVSYAKSVDSAVELAIRLKRQNNRQFVGFLADPILHTHGLAGDALLPRDSSRLPEALGRFFATRSLQ